MTLVAVGVVVGVGSAPSEMVGEGLGVPVGEPVGTGVAEGVLMLDGVAASGAKLTPLYAEPGAASASLAKTPVAVSNSHSE